MLKTFSGLLHQHLIPGEVVGRLGGDEFAALIVRNGETDAFLHDLRKSVDEYNNTSGKPYNINYSFGELQSDSGQYTSLGEMIKQSDEVMYSRKQRKTL